MKYRQLAAFIILCMLILFLSILVDAETVMVPMTDGTKLATDILLPKDSGKFPVVILRTPYKRTEPFWMELPAYGFAIVVQSIRGRFGSEGVGGLVFLDDGWYKNKDGFDTVEWVKKQSWCNGKIGTFGVSALGVTQYMMAGSSPKDLKCQFVIFASSSLYHNCAYQGGAMRKEQMEDWLKSNHFGPEQFEMITNHPSYDDLWKSVDLSTRLDKVNWPIYHMAGWYDTFLQGNIDAFTGIQKHGGPKARGKQKLLIGPWSHGTFGNFKEMNFPNSIPSFGFEHGAWFEHWMNDKKNGIDKSHSVTYYTMGAIGEENSPGNKWQTSNIWPVNSNITPYYLQSDGKLSTCRLDIIGKNISYTYDPDNPVPSMGGNNLNIEHGPKDQSSIESRTDVLLFTSDILDNPIEVTGRIKARLWVSTDAKDTDFTAKLTDLYPDGRSMLVCDGIIRARYRKSFNKPEFMEAGKVYLVEVDLWSTSIIFNKGHRIRLAISSSNYPRFDANLNTGELTINTKENFKAQNTIYFDKFRPSALFLPVIADSKL